MIAYLAGKLFRKSNDHVIVDTGGVGYKVFVTPGVLQEMPAVGGPVALEIHTIVREDDLALYGFTDAQECRLFQNLLSVSGVGPKLALTILANASWHDVIEAIENDDSARLKAIKGIGDKTAKLIVLGLKNKLADWAVVRMDRDIAKTTRAPTARMLTQDAEAALMALGFSRGDVQKTLSSIKIVPESNLQQIIKDSLQRLGSGGPR